MQLPSQEQMNLKASSMAVQLTIMMLEMLMVTLQINLKMKLKALYLVAQLLRIKHFSSWPMKNLKGCLRASQEQLIQQMKLNFFR